MLLSLLLLNNPSLDLRQGFLLALPPFPLLDQALLPSLQLLTIPHRQCFFPTYTDNTFYTSGATYFVTIQWLSCVFSGLSSVWKLFFLLFLFYTPAKQSHANVLPPFLTLASYFSAQTDQTDCLSVWSARSQVYSSLHRSLLSASFLFARAVSAPFLAFFIFTLLFIIVAPWNLVWIVAVVSGFLLAFVVTKFAWTRSQLPEVSII